MFGLLDLGSCSLARNRRRFYMCGVCNALACGYGRFARLLLSGGDVFLSLLMAAQRRKILFDDSAPVGRCRFWSKKALRVPEFEFPAAVCMYFFGGRLVDDIHDNGSFRSRVLFALYRSKIRKAEEKLREFGLDASPVEVCMREQHRLEAEKGQGYGAYSHMVERLCSRVYSHAATLVGVPGNSVYLGEVGRHIGRVTYLVDGYVDSESDEAEGKFNVFNASSGGAGVETDSRELLVGGLVESLAGIRRNISRVELRRFEESIRFVVTDGLLGRVERFVAEAKVLGGKSVLYSAVPIVLPIILSSFLSGSSKNDICSCPCCSDCSSLSPSTPAGPTSNFGARATRSVVDAAVGAAVGFMAPPIFSRVINRFRSVDALTDEEKEMRLEENGYSYSGTYVKCVNPNCPVGYISRDVLNRGRVPDSPVRWWSAPYRILKASGLFKWPWSSEGEYFTCPYCNTRQQDPRTFTAHTHAPQG